jgi:hypothetical protein
MTRMGTDFSCIQPTTYSIEHTAYSIEHTAYPYSFCSSAAVFRYCDCSKDHCIYDVWSRLSWLDVILIF